MCGQVRKCLDPGEEKSTWVTISEYDVESCELPASRLRCVDLSPERRELRALICSL